MASDVSYPERKLPVRWKARLHDQPPIVREQPKSDESEKIAPGESPINVVMEPTEPVNAHGLPAFRIKQEIEPQPTDAISNVGPRSREVRISVMIGTIVIALLALAVTGIVLID